METTKCVICKEEYYTSKTKNFTCASCKLKKLNPKITPKQIKGVIELMNATTGMY